MNGPFVSALSPYYDTSISAFQRDVTKANSLLDGDGWVKGSDGTRSKNGVKLAWAISTTSGNSQRAAEEEQLIANWKDIGATVTVKNWPAGQFFNDYKGGGILATGNYDMGLYANNWAPDPDSFCVDVESSQIPTDANPAVRTGLAPPTRSWTRCASRARRKSTSTSESRSTSRSRRNGRTTSRPSSSTSDLTFSPTRPPSATSQPR